jgi:FixJ family two-component response regulator
MVGAVVKGCKAKNVAARMNLSESRVAELKRDAIG